MTLDQLAEQIHKALRFAYSGSAEDGSFIQGPPGAEYVPSVFMLIDQLKAATEAQRDQLEQAQAELQATVAQAAKTIQVCLDRAEKAEQQLAQVTQAQGRYISFIRAIMRSWPDGDLDGGELQELAHQYGILELHAVTEPCGESCQCADYGDFPTTCYRLTDPFRLEPSIGATK